jgi:phosphoglycerate dehydrogenase-like enzyme
LLDEIMPVQAVEALEGLGEVVWNTTGQILKHDEVAERIGGCAAVVTSWRPPVFDNALLDAADGVRIIGHAAGSVKHFITPSVFERSIAVTHASETMADAVAEWTLTMILVGLRRVHTVDRAMQSGEVWPDYLVHRPAELFRKRVGVVGASHVGRAVIRLLKPFDAEVLVYDPYLSDEDAATLGVRRVDSLEELMASSEVITNHAPTTDETSGMLDARLWGAVKDGVLFVNTARAAAVDYDALLRELQTGRISAALDVFESEPLAVDSPFRRLPNVILSPHAAGNTIECRLRLGETVVDELARFFAGEPLRHEVTADMISKMA